MCIRDRYTKFFCFTLMLENYQAIRGADSGAGHIQLAVGEAVTPQMHASHIERNYALCFIDGNGLPDFHRELQSFELNVMTVSKECGGLRLSPRPTPMNIAV